jgi:hypothetical protein
MLEQDVSRAVGGRTVQRELGCGTAGLYLAQLTQHIQLLQWRRLSGGAAHRRGLRQ